MSKTHFSVLTTSAAIQSYFIEHNTYNWIGYVVLVPMLGINTFINACFRRESVEASTPHVCEYFPNVSLLVRNVRWIVRTRRQYQTKYNIAWLTIHFRYKIIYIIRIVKDQENIQEKCNRGETQSNLHCIIWYRMLRNILECNSEY